MVTRLHAATAALERSPLNLAEHPIQTQQVHAKEQRPSAVYCVLVQPDV